MPLTEEQLKYGELLSTMEHPLPVTADLFAAAVAEIRGLRDSLNGGVSRACNRCRISLRFFDTHHMDGECGPVYCPFCWEYVELKARVGENIESRFRILAAQWKEETGFMSSVEQISMHPAYQQIIGMGKSALPLILTELSRKRDHWFWALSAITGENPVRPEDVGNIERMTESWMQLGREMGWYNGTN